MIEISASEARTHWSKLLARVERGQTLTITRNGQPVAVLKPLAEPKPGAAP